MPRRDSGHPRLPEKTRGSYHTALSRFKSANGLSRKYLDLLTFRAASLKWRYRRSHFALSKSPNRHRSSRLLDRGTTPGGTAVSRGPHWLRHSTHRACCGAVRRRLSMQPESEFRQFRSFFERVFSALHHLAFDQCLVLAEAFERHELDLTSPRSTQKLRRLVSKVLNSLAQPGTRRAGTDRTAKRNTSRGFATPSVDW